MNDVKLLRYKSAGAMDSFNSSQTNFINDSSFTIDKDPNQKARRFKWPSYTKLVVKLTLFLLFTAYFLWASYHFFHVNFHVVTFNETTCNGYGFLVYFYIVVFLSFLYYMLFKPYALPLLNQLLEPWRNWCQNNPKFGDYCYYIFCAAFFVGFAVYLGFDTADNRNRLIPLGGLAFFIAIGWLLSANKKQIAWRTVLWGLKLQFIFGLLTIRWDVGRNTFDCLGGKINTFLDYAKEGSTFVYSERLVLETPAVFAFSAITTIYFLAFIINILYYYGFMQNLVGIIGEFLQFVMDTTICESVNCAANIFLGPSEAPLLIKPYLKDLTDSELHSIVTSGFATVSGTVLAAYIIFGADPAALITASVMSAPAALCYSKLLYPETEEIQVTKEKVSEVENEFESVLDAATQGINTAFQIVAAICGSLIAFISFVAMVNGILSWFGLLVGYSGADAWTLNIILGKIFRPISFLMGVPWDESEKVGQLIGIKTIINEFVAYENMGKLGLTARSKLIATYAICGFANPGSIGIMIASLTSLIPHKKAVIIKVLPRAFLGGVLVCFMTACIAGMLVPESALK